METEGWGKFREAVVGSEAGGLYGLLRGVTSCFHLLSSQPPLKQSHLVPSSTVSQPSPQEPTGPEASDPTGQAMVSASSAATPALEGDIPVHMQPLRVQMGPQSAYISARLRVAKRACQPLGLPLVPM